MCLQGTGVSGGIGIGRVVVLDNDTPDVTRKAASLDETARFNAAVRQLSAALMEKAGNVRGAQAEILESHVMLLGDPIMQSEILGMIVGLDCNSEYASHEILEKYAAVFEMSGDELMTARASDLRDIKNNLIRTLCGEDILDVSELPEGTVLVARELTASVLAGVDPEKVCALITREGGKTSHMAIIARSLGLPAVVGISEQVMAKGSEVIVNGDTGEVIREPSAEVLSGYNDQLEKLIRRKQELERFRGLSSQTVDGETIHLFANIGLEADIQKARLSDAEGVGLFRTEFLYMNRSAAPTEEEQFLVYKKAAEAFNLNPVIIRTLDVGGDKDVPYLDLEKEENPFLGWRAIRYCLDRTELFSTQLRAILRASAFGNVKIMLPMVTNTAEFHKAKELIEQIKSELLKKNITFNKEIAVGIMVETPAAAIMADRFAEIADFFSIGTNDLTQYIMAADRGNLNVAPLCSTYDPAVLRLIYNVARAAKTHGIPCGICGEAGADPMLTRFFIGVGVDELSMVGTSVLQVREIVRGACYVDVKDKIEKELFSLRSAEEAACFLSGLS